MMGRDLQIETEVEKDNERSAYSEVKKPYRAFLDENWDAMKIFYEKNPQLIFKPLTIEGDTAFHIAAYSERTKLLRCFLGLVPNSRLSEVFLSKNCHGNSTLHEVASTDNIEAAELLISKLQMAGDLESTASRNINQVTLKELLEDRNQLGETPLYRSAALGKPKMLKFLAKRVGNIKDHFQRNDTVSILHIAVFGQHYDIAIWLLEKDKELGKRKTASGMTCLHVLAKMSSAFKSSSHEDNIIKTLLYHCLPQHLYDRDDEDEDDKDDGSSDGHEAGVRDLESELSSKNPRVTKTHPSAISRIYNAMWRTAAKEWPSIEKVWKRRRTNKSALKLTKLLVQMDTTWEKSLIVEDKTLFLGSVDSLDDVFIDVEGGKEGKSSTSSTTATVGEGKSSGSGSEQEPYTPLLIAATEGIVEIVHEILQHHPQAIEHLSKDEENILHVTISHRQIKVFKYLKKMDVILRCRLVSRLNVRGYTILHQVADIKNSREGNETGGGGPAFVLSEELKWFERVQKMMPAHYTLHRDNEGRTASELFREQHAPLLKEAKKWLIDTIGSCTTVAILVAGVVFAAGYSVPGGTDESGVPRSLHSPIYMAFTITDIIALVSSLISVVMFLMITSSPLEQEYFHYKIPRKLMIGFSFLFFSMILAMISFSASLLLILRYDQKRSWTQTVIYAVALLPICLFGIFQFPLYASLTRTLHYLHKTITKKILPQAFLPHKSLKKGKRKSY
ncbi:uncharacterized protein LOC121267049 [Juglans microcarpa x Juglans regia]|uniref:uncharacterized protein LOC121267049 n=1 Tax=Juglans microcarpa x Juglans regia TaxID=2249226 RepID=UPI001B7DBA21|nr:uncharacterized protein LOC121267049 [Juglans microcarpa x Juglans regia]